MCWGRNDSQQSDVPDTLVNPIQVSAGLEHSCAVDDNGVTCWGKAGSHRVVPDTLVNPTSVSAGGLSTCAIDDSGVTCWGAPGIVNVPSLSNPTQVTVGFDHACAQDDTGVVCWGDNDKGKSIVPALEYYVTDNDSDGGNADSSDDDPAETADTDGDGVVDNTDIDDDNDGVDDVDDHFPKDASETVDTDSNGVGNNADNDDDGDGIPDNLDRFPLIPYDQDQKLFDIDGDGQVDALTDTLLITRYVFGFTGNDLIKGAVGEDATRTSSAEIEAYLEALIPEL